MPEQDKTVEYLRWATAELQKTRAELAAHSEPLAIVGMACRLPGGVGSPEDLWQLLESGGDGITAFPTDRGWETTADGRGGFLTGAAGFDAAFFGISPREALAMDPQQRLALETSWEAFEHAGIDPQTLRGSDTGVFLGAFFQGYGIGADFDGYGTTSIHTSVLSGRLAYFYGLEGPAVTVDTACSSSLVALHQAGQSLRSGECSLALVGGVTVMASPAGFADFSEQGGLAPDARCKAFAEAADGTGFAEGSGVLIVEKLSDAERNGHRVLAVVRGSAVNQDGASNGLSAPNGPSQERVIRQALANAGLTPADVDAVEAHGTGTRLGDPIEAQAVLATYGQGRDTPLLLGSLKSNIGHTQAAAGVAGVIKMVLAMRHGTLPRTLHVDTPSSHVDWTAGAVELLTDARPWPETDRPRRAGVSSFGVSGTNAHIILESHPRPAPEPDTAPDTGPLPLLLSARTPQALDAQVHRLRAFLDDNPGADRVAVAQTLARRTQFEHRAVLLGDTLITVSPNAGRGPVVFVYSGQSTLHPHTGRQLAATYPVFADAWREALDHLDPAQGPATHFAHQTALTALLRSWGITPHAVIGHSLGEITAAHAAGVLSLRDAGALLTTRTRLMDQLPAGGAMVTVLTSEEKARQVLRPGVEIAAVNGPHSLVLSGDEEAVLEAARQLGIHHRLPTRHAGHSERMQPLVAPLLELARTLTYHQPHTAIPGDPTTAEYWAHQVRDQVRFQAHTEQYPGATFLEIGPNQDLSPLVDGVAAQTGTPDEVRALHTALAQLHVRGVAIDWTLVLGGDRAPVTLPTYPFQHKDYWLRPTSRADVTGAGQEQVAHPLLGAAVALPGTGGVVLTGRLSLASHPWLGEHAVDGTVLLPGAAFLELAARAGDEVGCDLLHELVIETPLVLPATGGVAVSVEVAEPDDTGRRAVTVHARADGSGLWTRHAGGFLGTAPAPAPAAGADPAPWPPTEAGPVDVADVYDRFEDIGYSYGPGFRGLRAAWRAGDTVYAEVALPDEQNADAARFTLHPALLDAAFQAGALAALDAPGGAARLPFSFQDVHIHAAGATRLRVTVGRDGERSTVRMTGPDGQLVAVVGSVLSRPYAEGSGDGLLRPVWTELPMPVPSADDPRVEVLGADPGDGDVPAATRELTARVLGALQHHLSAAEDTTLVVRTGTGPAAAAAAGLVRSAQAENPGRVVLVEASPDTPVELLAACAALDEPQLAVRDGVLFAPRLVRVSDPAHGPLSLPDGDWLLTRSASGTLHDVALTADDTPRRALEAGEVRIDVRAAGLNFRDVLIALGTYTGATAMGGEAAGVVVETGPGVDDLSPGDRVFGLTRGGIGPTAVTDRRWLARIPDGWSFTTAASVPIVFATAWYGLVDLGTLRAGEKVLVHAATGGVGMAAAQIARHLGAELYATASTGKQHVLRAAGLPDTHIADSRTTAFRTAFPRMDVVLNALTGEFIDASLDLLDADGRFVEMGRTELRDPAAIVPAYLPFDLLDAGADRIGEILGELLRLFDAGALEPLPVRAWDVRQARDALGWMSRARHIGKNVLTLPRPLDPEGAVVITGGSGTLAGILARHLRERHVYLLSRTAPPEGTPGVHLPCDVGDRDQLAAALGRVDRPITAVVHLAGALDDGTVASLTPERFDTVLRPKADGAWYLHELTKEQDLAAFVLYSSAAGVLGNAGQGNYVAANAFLDALAELRHGSGLPALSIAWGLWEDVSGLTAALGEADRDRMRRSGFRAITAQQGMHLYEAAGRTGSPVVVAAALDDAPDVPLLRGLRRTTVRRAAVRERSSADRLAALTGDELAEALLTLVRESTAAVLGHVGGEDIPATAAFKDLGIDSLTAVQLRNALTEATGVRLNATAVFDFPTPHVLAGKLGDELTGTRAPVVPRTAATAGAHDEPLAIVGMACRLPGGVASPEELWHLVASGTDAITEFPTDRGWDVDAIYDPDPDAIGKTFVRHGGFLTGATGFDAAFFGISPREALAMDPQQRVLLETSWEAFESAGITPDSTRGSDTGVFVGAFSYGYGTGADTDGFGATGSQTSVLSGRLSYFYGLEGPAVTVDTACSSSLVALHQAGQSLRSGECSLALVGGVTVMASPGGFVEFSRQRGLAPDGRAKAFGAGADGTSFAEGAGVLIVERLSDAERNGHTVLAVVRGSAVNQDGASNGLSAPNGPSQERVIRQALANAGLTPADVDAVEAHGTGTRLGDPIEAQAVLATYGQERATPLLLGSLKSNIGHAQAASGVAGIIKMVQALRHGELPPTLHADEPSPHVDWTAGAVELLTSARPWPETDRPRRAAVSSFGVSGTNAHVILEAGPVTETPAASPAGDLPLLVSARSPEALDEQIRRLRGYLDTTPDVDRVAVAQTLARRTHFAHRAVLLGDTVITTPPADRPDELVFVYSGQGTQHPAMGEQLAAAHPVFADAWHEALRRLDDPDPHDPTHSQHVLFAHQAAFTALLRSWGITPHAVIGHSLGEITAAHAAGILSLDDACTLITTRARLMHTLPPPGAMVTVLTSEEKARQALRPGVEIAAVNGPHSLVLSGDEDAVLTVAGQLGIHHRLPAPHAGHSAHMEPVAAELLATTRGLRYNPPHTSIPNDPTTAEYWAEQVRKPVLFHAHTQQYPDAVFVEIGPAQDLSPLVDGIPLQNGTADEVHALHTALAHLYARGATLDWPRILGGGSRHDADVPAYAFQRRHYWIESARPAASDAGHPVLGSGIALAGSPGRVFTGSVPTGADRAVFVAELALAAADAVDCATVERLAIASVPSRPGHGRTTVQTWVDEPADDGRRRFTVHTRTGDAPWTLHAEGVLRPHGTALPDAAGTEWPPPGAVPADGLPGVWRRGDQVFAEADVDGPDGFVVHPDLLDAVFSAVGDGSRQPAGWRDLTVHASDATVLRACLTRRTDGAMGLAAFDGAGLPVLTAEAVTLREVASTSGSEESDGLLRLEWLAVAEAVYDGDLPEGHVLITAAHPDDPEDIPTRAHTRATRVLTALQHHLTTTDHTLIVHTTTDPAGATVTGLTRTAQNEHPHRIRLIETDHPHTPLPLAQLATLDHPHLRLTHHTLHHPHLTPHHTTTPPTTTPLNPEHAIIITGGSGTLAGILARHLNHPHTYLLSRTPPPDTTPGTHLPCDVGDPHQLATTLAHIPQPLTAIFHTAATLDDGIIDALTPDRLTTVLHPKANAAWHLHHLTQNQPLTHFVLYSSAAAVLGSPGQGNYAAANAFLDALATHRHTLGQPATSIAWGMWHTTSTLTGQLSDADRDRIRRGGFLPITDDEGMRLYEAAVGSGEDFVMAAAMDPAQPMTGSVPPILSGLRRSARRVARAGQTFAQRLAELPDADRGAALVTLVSDATAAVLGHADASEIAPTTTFKDLGIDSLTAIELRNRLAEATGLRLSATLVFDHPTPRVLAAKLRTDLFGTAVPTPARTARTHHDEPLAIVGMACRLPGGVASPEDLWQLVASGTDAITEFPTDRGWDIDRLFDPDPDAPGKTYVRHGGFLAEAAGFDAAFFGISPREARAMDPQQRVILETSWEAFENAGIVPDTLRGSDTGVFMGAFSHGYGAGVDLGGFGATATQNSVLSGRLSYFFGMEGPAVTVDTACSSSLVALHQAAQALRTGECSLALAGGVTVMPTPLGYVEFCRQRGLAPDGRAKAFAEGADGTSFSEGAGVLVLERLSDAERNGHTVLAVVRSSAVNQDGASNGISAPNGPSQQRVIRQALDKAGLAPADVDVVEAHGTGTPLGDPIEAQAIIATYGQDRDTPLYLGSVKSNIGHTQTTAGVAGVIKMVMAMRHGIAPKTLHVDEPSSHVDWTEGAVELLTDARPWPDAGRPRRAGVSSLGISGTNAHVILEGVPGPSVVESVVDGLVPLPVSARSEVSLRGQVERLEGYLRGGGVDVAAVAQGLVRERAVFGHRTVLLGDARVTGVAVDQPRTVFVFPGQGAQWVGMGVELMARSAVFAARMEECAQALLPHTGWDVREMLSRPDVAERVEVVQPASWAVAVSLAALWQAHGVVPDAVIGHSQGEIAAACVAGALSLEDAARVVALRSQVIAARLAGRGAMASVALPAGEVGLVEGVWIAARNGPSSTVVAGEPSAVEEVVARYEADGVRVRRIAVDYASHTPHVEAIEDELAEVLEGISGGTGSVAWWSTVDSAWVTEPVDEGYWYRNLRRPVALDAAVAELDGSVFVECSAHPVLLPAMEQAHTVASLRTGDGGWERWLTALAQAWTLGAAVDWDTVVEPVPGRLLDLPTYAFEHRRYWLEAAGATDLSAAGLTGAAHPMLAAVTALPADDGGVVLTGRISLRTHPWLADHAVRGTVLLPGTAFVELVIRAGDETGCGVVDELVIETPLVVPVTEAVDVSVTVEGADEAGRRPVTVHARTEGTGSWTRHASGTLTPDTPNASGVVGAEPFSQWPPATAAAVDTSEFYSRLDALGYRFGPMFRGMRAAWRDGDTVYAEVALPEDRAADADGFGMHPALLDAALQSGSLLMLESDGEQSVQLPFSWHGVRFHATGATMLRVAVVPGPDGLRLHAADSGNRPVATIDALVTRSPEADLAPADPMLRVGWAPVPVPAGAGPSDADVLTLRGDDADPLGETRDLTTRVLDALLRADRPVIFQVTGGLAAKAAAGLVRTAQNEQPGRFFLVETDPSEVLDGAKRDAIAALGEPHVRLRDGLFEAARLMRATPSLTLPDTGSWQLRPSATGSLDDLAVVRTDAPDRPLAAGEVRIAVRAAGLNFRDVTVALGVVADERPLGSEAAGVVLETGPGVHDLAPGDRVLGMLAGAFGPVAITDRRLLGRMPDGWTFPQAASVMTAFATAWYGLVDLAGLRPGEKVLIHAAATGVGAAAVQIARHLGAEVYATTSAAKRHLVDLDGAHLADSRSTAFADAFPPVDVVLNSLTGELLDASVGLLAPGGRFIEMGKTDIRHAVQQPFDLMDAGPDRMQRIIVELLGLFARDVLHPLPVHAWDVRQAREAFGWMSSGRHTGKLVLTIPRPLDPEGAVVITGGSGTLAGILARHLNHPHTYLLSRTPPPDTTPGTHLPCDVGDPHQLATTLARIPQPLTAVFHTAGTLDDALLDNLTPDRIDTVLKPKADAAWHLHRLTRDTDLAAFVVYSAVAGLMGSPGQGNYVAANAFLDALAEHRRTQGLPAQSLAWGMWADVSALTAKLTDADRQRIRRSGFPPLSAADGMRLFDAATRTPEPVVVATTVDLTQLDGPVAPLLRGLAAHRAGPARTVARNAGEEPLAVRLAGRTAAEQRRIMQEVVLRHAAAVLAYGLGDRVAADRPFRELGFDSLTAVDLRNRLAAETGLRLPTTLVFSHPTAEALTAHLLELIDAPTARIAGESLPAVTAAPVAAARDQDEPIAIVAMACRLPGGVTSPEDLWRLVESGTDAITTPPDDRGWDVDALYDADPDAAGKAYNLRGGYLDGAAEFDAAFFDISPREALGMDPQQRLLLETAWEAIERGRISPASLRGREVGVYVGAAAQGYGLGAEDTEGNAITGGSTSLLSGRLAYVLGLEGPAVTVDTACSSSLVALHLACQGLRLGECELALAGGVSVLSSPAAFVEFSRQRGLAADGRCKSFGAGADGTTWSEGVGVLVLERLSDAERLGHTVLAVVRGSAVTSDGASNGLTAPNGLSQQRVIRKALAAAGLTGADVDVVEGHGTGTRLGDPVEADALLATYGQNRPAPVWLGSLKSNIGHATAAAGVAGVIKMVQAIGAGTMPRTLHVEEPSPAVDWSTGQVSLLGSNRPWPDDARPRRAAVSAFGLSGTNAHVILEQHRPAPVASQPPRPPREESQPLPWVLSARTPDALRAQAARLRDHLAVAPDADPLDIGYALATSRAQFAHRAAVVATTPDGFRAALDGLADGAEAPGVVTGTAQERRVAFLFDGQGAQRAGMGRDLHRRFPVFAAAWDEVSDAFGKHLKHSPTDVYHGEHGALAHDTLYAQAGLFTLEVALLRLLEHWGVRPDVLVGHSVGEVTAAYAAGVLTLADATELIVARGRALRALPPGAMIAVDGSPAEVGARTDLDIAAVNGPSAVVLAGSPDDVAAFEREWSAAGRRTKRLDVGHAFHSRHVDGALDGFRTVLESLAFGAARLPVVSTTTGRDAADDLITPAHWLRHARRTVLFSDAVRELADRGVTTFVAVGPSGSLASAAAESAGEDAGTYHAVLRARTSEETAALTALAELHAHGVPVDLAAVLAGGRPVDLPVYAFQHRSYWLAPAVAGAPATVADTGGPAESEPEDLTVAEIVRRRTAALLGVTDPADVDAEATFFALGFDSLAVQRLRNQLASATGLDLPAAVLFDHDTPAALTAFLQDRIEAGQDRIEAGEDDDAPTVLSLLEEMESLDAADIAATPAPERAAIADLLDKLAHTWKDYR
ncbi:tacrolimus type I polyketide synthase FkbA [Streptomyces luomodiensis]|uniref:Tacrolimus type I polyketide synthase FkbA n=1 Tax=Streptomyces luomodiensis TaxID=3026192 RepID=A0ABY9V7V4_9ACTN|nr:tacrolimus type I polyketide synthase FkbA [Streptomyces sp. SCA4-21]WNF00985.1 tacrolimus type I polyketide synthase FkbA [Streptomyces sp. SCA4-21]